MAAPAFDAVSTGVASNTGTTLTDSITTGAISDGFLVIEIGHVVSSTTRTLYVTVDGLPAGRIGWRNQGNLCVEMFGFIAPAASSTLSVVATLSGTNNDSAMKCRSYSGVHQGRPYRNVTAASALTSAPSLTISSVSGETAISVVYHDHTDVWSTSDTERYELDPISNDGGLIGLEGAGAASVTLNGTLTGAEEWASIGCSLRPADADDIAVESQSFNNGDNTTSVVISSHVIGGSDRYLVVAVTHADGSTTGGRVTSVATSPSGDSLSQLVAAQLIGGPTIDDFTAELWGIKAPATGDKAITVTWDTAVNDACVHAINYINVDQTTPTSDSFTASGTANTIPETSVTNIDDGEIALAAFTNDSTNSPTPIFDHQLISYAEHKGSNANDETGLLVGSWGPDNASFEWLLRGTNSEQWALAGIKLQVVQPSNKQVTLDGVLQAIETKTATLNAIAVDQNSVSATLNAIAQQINTETATLGAVLEEVKTLGATLNAQISAASGSETAEFNAILQAINTLTASLSGVVQTQGNTQDATLNAIVTEVFALTVTVGGVIQETLTETTSLDAILTDGSLTLTTTIDAIAIAINSATALFDGVLAATQTLTATLNGQIIATVQLTAALDGVLRRTEATQVTLDAYLEFAFGVWAPRAQGSASWSPQGDASGIWTPVDPADPTSWT